MVKAVFDLYRFDLLDKLGIERPENRDEERVIWTKVSQAIVYRLPDSLPEIKLARPPGDPSTDAPPPKDKKKNQQ